MNITYVYFVVILCFLVNNFIGGEPRDMGDRVHRMSCRQSHKLETSNPTTESFHHVAHYSNITFNEARATCTDYEGKLAEFPEDYNFSVLISSIGLSAYSQFWINASTYLNCTCLATFKHHWIIEGINCNSKVYYICRQPFATSGSLVKTDKSFTSLQTPVQVLSSTSKSLQMQVQQISPSSTLHEPAPEFSLGLTSLQRPAGELSPCSKTLNTQVPELSANSPPVQVPIHKIPLTSTPTQTPVSELSQRFTSQQMPVEELSLTSIVLKTQVQQLSPTLVSELSPTSASSVHVLEGHSRNDSSLNSAYILSPTSTPFSPLPENGLTTTVINMTQFSCVQVCCSDFFRYCNNGTREFQRNISIAELIKELSIDKRSTGKHSRRLYSAYDSRSSSKAMGVGAMLIICSILTCIVAMDLPKIIVFFYNKLSSFNKP